MDHESAIKAARQAGASDYMAEIREVQKVERGAFWFAVIGFAALVAFLLLAHFGAPYL